MEELIPGLMNDLGRECLIRLPYQAFPTATSVSQSWRREIESPLYRRLRKSAGLSQRLLVLAQARPDEPGPAPEGGAKGPRQSFRLAAFEPGSGRWAGLPEVPGGLPLFCGVAGAGPELVVVGGWDPATWRASAGVFVYSFLSGEWRRGADMPGPRRSFFGCASDGDRTVVVAGGHDEDKNALRSALAYDVAADAWAPLADMARERDECRAIFHRGKFHVIGGYPTESQGCFGRCAESLDPATWRWGPVEDEFLGPDAGPGPCAAGPDGLVYGLVGRGEADVAARRGDVWQVVATTPEEVRSATWAAGCGPDKLVVIGSQNFGEPHNGYLLDLKTYKWSKIEMPEEYSGHVQCGCVMEL